MENRNLRVIAKTFSELYSSLKDEVRYGLMNTNLSAEDIQDADYIVGYNEDEDYVKVFKDNLNTFSANIIPWKYFGYKEWFIRETSREKIILKKFTKYYNENISTWKSFNR